MLWLSEPEYLLKDWLQVNEVKKMQKKGLIKAY